VLVAVVIGTLRMSDRLTLALAARGLATSTNRTVWRDLQMRTTDWVALAGLMLAFGVLVWSRFAPLG
jgi:energy-coupling factor transporter transmembrane protein EcfT